MTRDLTIYHSGLREWRAGFTSRGTLAPQDGAEAPSGLKPAPKRRDQEYTARESGDLSS